MPLREGDSLALLGLRRVGSAADICPSSDRGKGRVVPRRCSVCEHDEGHQINVCLVQRDSYRDIARQFGVSKDALSRHAKEHLPALLVKAKDAAEGAEADSLLDRIEALQSRTLSTLDEVEQTDDYRARLGAIREARANLELIGEVTKELNRTPTLNLHLNPEWLELRAVIVGALGPHPEARESVLRAIKSAENSDAA